MGKCEEAVHREAKAGRGREINGYKDLPLLSTHFYLDTWLFLYTSSLEQRTNCAVVVTGCLLAGCSGSDWISQIRAWGFS